MISTNSENKRIKFFTEIPLLEKSVRDHGQNKCWIKACAVNILD